MALGFICGPYADRGNGTVEEHIEMARRAAIAVLKAGHFPIVPHCNTGGFEHLSDLPDSVYAEGYLYEVLPRCSFLVRLPGWQASKGSQPEVAMAERLRMPIYEYDPETDEVGGLVMSKDERQAAIDVLIRAGLVLPEEPPDPYARRLTDEERAELAKQITGKPLSEIIIEERR